ncbi:MAG: long-chain fatty acid--CoA ligase [Mycobacteriales bacterium]|nr:MAG: long-chain fatty acid--CoA ligase [Pseudonocardiales bacterium]
MQGLMQDYQLTLPPVFARAERMYGDKELVTATADGVLRQSYADWAAETRRLGGALDTLGISAEGRVGTFAWNTARHVALYWAIPCTGRVLHTLNIRLFAEQLTYIVNHADDEVIFVDRSLLPVFTKLLPTFEKVRHVVVMDDGADAVVPDDPRMIDYRELVDGAEPVDFGVDDENRAAAMCYTSGTTGNPKGVVYSQRSLYLHGLSAMMSTGLGIRETDRVLPVVPLFHANAWGLAQTPIFTGADLVLPGPGMAPEAIAALISSERVTFTAGVPTIWMGMLPLLDSYDFSSLRRIVGGGSAVPKALSEAYREKLGIPIVHAWGMTETSPLASVSLQRSSDAALSAVDQADQRARQGFCPVGVECRIVVPDTGEELPWDDTATGELQVRGPWIASGYYDDDRSAESFTSDGWLRTGDVAAVDTHGSIRLVDRTKDLVKSGGEWISSVELENRLMAHPAVAEAAVIGVPHPRWQERPIACVVLEDGATAGKDELIDHLRPHVAKWWLPDDVVFIDEVPKTSVGKFSKKDLRAQLADYVLPAGASPVDELG